MSIDLNTNGQALSSAVHCVLDGKWSWVIFGYMGLTYTLDVKNQGHDVGDFVNEFTSGRVLYGFVRVTVNSAPAKFVLIAWQGEGSSESFKIACARHIDFVKRLCRTVHLTIQARSEADLDWNEIVTKVGNLTGTVCNTQEVKSNDSDDEFIPKGSVYERANPNQDIPKGCVSRSIWQSQLQKQQDSSKVVFPVKKSKPFGLGRPVCAPASSNNITTTTTTTTTTNNHANHNGNDSNHVQPVNRPQNNLKPIPQNEVTTTIKSRIKALESNLPSNDGTSGYRKVDPRAEIMLARKLSNSTSLDDNEDDSNHVGTCYKKLDPRSEILAARAYKEAHQSIFNNDEPVGTNYKRPDVEAEIRAARSNSINTSNKWETPLTVDTKKSDAVNGSSNQNSISSSQNNFSQSSIQKQQEKQQQQQQQPLSSPPLSLSPIVHISNNQLHCNSVQHTNNYNDNNNNNTNNYSHHNQVQPQDSSTKIVSPSSPSAPMSTVQQATKENLGFKAVCLYDYVANEDDELSFRYGEELFRIEQIDEGWWLGQNAHGQIGLFPSNYVKLVAITEN
ncbi:unnamed protein product [Trichobilharzia szidati]|nr:unnamed protein product [Trichobilharzia szidati]